MPEDSKELTFFNEIGGDVSPLSEEQKRAVAEFKNEGMGQEAKGLPITYPRVDILHQGTVQYKFRDSDTVVKQFAAVILHIEASKVWWPTKFGAGKDSGGFPKCFSRDLFTPDPNSEMKQSDSCAKCPNNAYGSDVREDGSSGRGKSCKEVRRIFFIPAGHLSAHWMAVPPSSLRGLGTYLNRIADAGVKRPQEIVTVFKLKGTSNQDGISYSELLLEPGPKVPDNVLFMMLGQRESILKMIEVAAPMTEEEYKGKDAPKT